MKKVIIASENPVKINAVAQGFGQMMDGEEYVFEGIGVASGVGDQPMTEEETLLGAVNRAIQAKKAVPKAKFWVGIEGGVSMQAKEMNAYAWVYILEASGKSGKARTGAFYLPADVVYLVNQGIELGKADDLVFSQKNSKQQGGSVGILTHGVLDRTAYYTHAVVLALIPFVNQHLYFEEEKLEED